MRTFTIILITCLTQVLNSLGQEQINLSPSKRLSQYPIESWSMDEGLPSDMTIKILQDSTGYLWFATYKGIAQFDGVNFSNYNHTTSAAIKSVTIQDLTQDAEGNLWFASQRGVAKFSDNSFTTPEGLDGLSNISVEAIYFDSTSNTIWLGTTSDGLFRYNYKILEPLPSFLELTHSVIKEIKSDSNGNIWIGTQWGEVIKYDGKSFHLVATNRIMGGIEAFYFTNRDSTFWVAAQQGIFKLEDNELKIQTNIPIKQANAIIEDNHKTLWVGTDNGLFRYNLKTRKLDSLKEETGIPNNLIRDIFPDKEGNLWVATYRRGMFKLTDGAVTSFSTSEGLSSNIITTIAQKDSDTFYIGDEMGTINILTADGISRLNLKHNIAQNRLKNLYIDSKNNLWISTYMGLLKREPNGNEMLLNYQTGFPTETIRLVFEDSRKNIWVGTRTMGLFRIKPNGEIIDVFDRETGLSSNYIMHVTEDKLGRIVVSTKNGINIIENYMVTKVISMENGLPSNFTFNVYIDNENIYWASSNDGIFRIENDQNIFVFNTENGLFDNVLFDILEDNHGYFWIPSDIGIARISKNELNDFAGGETNGYSYSIYDRSDGMKESRCIGATKSIKTTNGNFAITTSGGVAFVNPSNIAQDEVSVKTIIERIIVGEEEFKSNEKVEVLPSNDHISIQFTAFNYKSSKKIAFRYKLSPFDNEWIESDETRTARYTNLPPGEYTFHVQSTLDKSKWSNDTAKATIIVHESWWQTWWFITSMALLFSMFLFLIYKARTYTVKRQKQELERLVKVRTALIADQKRELEMQAEELEKLSIVASHTDNAILITSPQGDIQWVNESFTRIYGYTVEEFIEAKHKNLAKVSKDPNIQHLIQKCIDTHQPVNYTIEVAAKDGKKIWIQTCLTPIKNEAGKVISIVAIDSDITALKNAEQEMINMNDEIVTQAEAILQQNEEIQTQRDELEQINNLLIKHTQNIEASIWYAHTIQKAILPTKQSLNQHFESFVVFKPRDIVSGDFYWYIDLTKKDELTPKVLVAVVDCTGHGVPGALMSMIGSRLLSEIVNERHVTDPASILMQLNKLVNVVLKQDSEDSIDGMDIALCHVELNKNSVDITFAGANRPLYILEKDANEIVTIKGNRKTIGGIMPDIDAEFTNKTVTLKKGDMIIMNSDGYTDQNRADGKKFSVSSFHKLLIENANQPLENLEEIIDIRFDEYRGAESQRDDTTVLGIKF
ncbi:MAG: two-component regulator propeller domain-containing protein [Bacteroidales bacterium]